MFELRFSKISSFFNKAKPTEVVKTQPREGGNFIICALSWAADDHARSTTNDYFFLVIFGRGSSRTPVRQIRIDRSNSHK